MAGFDQLAQIAHPTTTAKYRIPRPLAWGIARAVSPFTDPTFRARRLEYPFCGWVEAVTRSVFRRVFDREIDLEDPKTFNEKINWLKLYGQ